MTNQNLYFYSRFFPSALFSDAAIILTKVISVSHYTLYFLRKYKAYRVLSPVLFAKLFMRLNTKRSQEFSIHKFNFANERKTVRVLLFLPNTERKAFNRLRAIAGMYLKS